MLSVILTDVNILLTPKRQQAAEQDGDDEREDDVQEEEAVNEQPALVFDPVQKEQMVQDWLAAQLLQRATQYASSPTNGADTISSNNTTEATTASSPRWRWLQDSIADILSNLSVTVRNIHIRYEDPGTSMGFAWTNSPQEAERAWRYRQPFAIGITLKQFSVKSNEPRHDATTTAITTTISTTTTTTTTTDPTFATTKESKSDTSPVESVPEGLGGNVTIQRKRVAAERVAVYWDSDCRIMAEAHGQARPEYYEAVFTILNGDHHTGINEEEVPHILRPSEFCLRHSYLLPPFSPSVDLNIVQTIAAAPVPIPTKDPVSEAGGRSSRPEDDASAKMIPSTMNATLPPFRLTMSRDVLEDLGYIRQSFAVWNHATKGAISEKSLRRLIRLRPKVSPKIDPRGWWKYAYEVVLAVQLQQYEQIAATQARSRLQKDQKNARGWLGLARAMARQKRYTELHKLLLSADENSADLRTKAHLDLLELERNLTVDEIVAFRIASYYAMKTTALDIAASNAQALANMHLNMSKEDPLSGGSDDGSFDSFIDTENSSFSVERRVRMFMEMAGALEQEHLKIQDNKNMENKDKSPETVPNGLDDPRNVVSWVTAAACPEVSLQIFDRSSRRSGQSGFPVVRLSFVFLLEQRLFRDGSWDMTNRIGSFQVKDCTAETSGEKSSPHPSFPYLVGPKGGEAIDGDRTLYMNGVAHHQSVRIRIRRSMHYFTTTERGSTTTTEVSVLPLEIVYSTTPVEALSRILSTANLEFSDDYHRVASRVYEWRDRQRKRLLQALAHKRKNIFVDIDVGAPVLLVPENSSRKSPMLVMDLGRLQFRNKRASEQQQNKKSKFDDNWCLDLTNIQVQCLSADMYRSKNSSDSVSGCSGGDMPLQQLVEPFSVDFAIATRVHHEQDSIGDTGIHVRVDANLPRLVVNVSSSAVRLIKRLGLQWEKRKIEHDHYVQRSFDVRRSSLLGHNQVNGLVQLAPRAGTKGSNSLFEFRFKAPSMKVRVENDVDGRDCRTGDPHTKTPLVDLAMRGMDGELFTQKSTDGTSHVKWTARLRSLDALDLYQGAGDEFAYLISSVAPNFLSSSTQRESSPHLVIFAYDSKFGVDGSFDTNENFCAAPSSTSPSHLDDGACPRLSIKFHELYVEWNPETLAALHFAMKLPTQKSAEKLVPPHSLEEIEEDDLFFDAEEEDFQDAESLDILGQRSSFLSDPAFSIIALEGGSFSSEQLKARLPNRYQSLLGNYAPFRRMISSTSTLDAGSPAPRPLKQRSEVLFELSKLRVHFNKESRHRRLIIAEMDGTSVYFAAKSGGGSTTRATIGNLVFSDADSLQGKTLYREIVGLKADSTASSLFEFELTRCPRSRRYETNEDALGPTRNFNEGVVVHVSNGQMAGYDSRLTARFSPMRFVFLEQLWFEFMDYFFEGIIGFEVWGSQRPELIHTSDGESDAPNADKVSFMKLDIILDSPVILLPVSYCCTDYMRLEASKLTLTNFYNYADMRLPDEDVITKPRKQWYNNYEITLQALKIESSLGGALNDMDCRPTTKISLNWPIGPSAPLNSPKWHVVCSLEPIYLSLQPEDYALLQHIIQYNIGEESRHLDEWYALKNLPPLVLERYKQDIMVHFGYDKKDVAPATFDVSLSLPVICAHLRRGVRSGGAELKCEDVVWTYKKMRDLVSRQSVSCDLQILDTTSDVPAVLLSSRKLSDRNDADLTFTSKFQPPGHSFKTIEIQNPHIRINYTAWKSLGAFFEGLPQPTFLSPKAVIQVGDRWYKISESSEMEARESSGSRFNWIKHSGSTIQFKSTREKYAPSLTSDFRFSLSGPTIILGSDNVSLVLRADDVKLRSHGIAPAVNREVTFAGVQMQALDAQRDKTRSSSLIEPWTFGATMSRCNGSFPCHCQSHSTRIDAGVLKTRAAYSDMTIAIDVCLRLAHEIKRTGSTLLKKKDMGDRSNPEKSIALFADNYLDARWTGLQLVVVDDSGRHFANAQDLVFMSVGRVDVSHTTKVVPSLDSDSASSVFSPSFEYSLRLSISSFDLADCLQSESSPFRMVATIRAAQALLPSDAEQAAVTTSNRSGAESRCAVELTSNTSSGSFYQARVRSIDLQYNPTMIIALQRLLGRLYKDAKHSLDAVFNDSLSSAAAVSGTRDEELQGKVTLAFNIEHLRVCLNKEHLGRQLLEAIFSDIDVVLVQSLHVVDVKGHIGTLDAWENQLFGGPGRNLLKVGNDGENFIDIHYRRFVKSKQEVISTDRDFPQWVMDHFTNQVSDGIDDCLDVSVAALEVVYFKDKSAELLDYLSSGMPGRGMGATSRAAKGFVTKRVETKSLLFVHVQSPTIRVPKNDFGESGLTCRLGKFTGANKLAALTLNDLNDIKICNGR